MKTEDNYIDKLRLSPVELADEISMSSRNYLLVEGETDKLFWDRLEGEFKYSVIVACKKECNSNKEYVKKVMEILNERKRENAKGIIDIDFDYINNSMCSTKYVFYYKYHDLEITLLKSESFNFVNKCISSKEKRMDEEELLKLLFNCSYILGVLRYINEKEEYGFNFHLIDYKKLFKTKNNEFNEENFLNYFYSKFNITKEKRVFIDSKIAEIKDKAIPKEYICNGHDVLNILSLLTIRKISNDSPLKYTEDIISKLLIGNFRCFIKDVEFEDIDILYR